MLRDDFGPDDRYYDTHPDPDEQGKVTVIDTAGIYDGMDDQTYHRDPVVGGSLSSTGARTILKSPARFAWERTHRVEKTVYDVGHAAHAKVLGVGASVVGYPPEHLTPSGNVSTKAATSAWATEQRAAGLVPVTPNQIADVDAMAEAILAHGQARALLEQPGKAEQSGFAVDPESGTWVRIRLDLLPDASAGRTIIVDLKTAVSADPRKFGKTAFDHGLHQQDDFYTTGLTLARGDVDPAFVFVNVEKEPPYLVSCVELDVDAKRIGRERNRRAINTYAECARTGTWPGYPDEIAFVELPRYAAIQHEEQYT